MYIRQAFPDPFQTLLFIAPGFDELVVTYCLSEFRKLGLAISLVSSTSDCCRSLHGLLIQPDLILGDLAGKSIVRPNLQLVIIPGGGDSTGLLLSDPRILHLCATVLQTQGYVAAFSSAQHLVVCSGLPISPGESHFLAQNDLSLTVFVQQLADYVSVAPL